MRTTLFALALAFLAGCAPVATQGPRPGASSEAMTGLFPSDATLLDDEDIVRILDAR